MLALALEKRRSAGSAMAAVMVLMVLLVGLGGWMTMTSTVGLEPAHESNRAMRAFYLADSGAQIGIASVRAAGGTGDDSSFAEKLAGGTVSVAITRESPVLYRIRSDARYEGASRSVEVHVRFDEAFELPGSLTIVFSNGVAVRSNAIAASVDGDATIDGRDHAPRGSLLADQTGAVACLAMNAVPGRRSFAVRGSSPFLEGLPNPIDDTAADMSAVLESVRSYAEDHADLQLAGSRVLGTAERGSHGSRAEPALVHVRLERNGTLTLGESYEGHGTLVIETEEATSASVLEMRGAASWHGLVLVCLRGRAEVAGGALVRASDDARIVGGLAMFLNARSAEIRGLGDLYHGSGRAAILHSSELISTARGTGAILGAQVVSYRLP